MLCNGYPKARIGAQKLQKKKRVKEKVAQIGAFFEKKPLREGLTWGMGS